MTEVDLTFGDVSEIHPVCRGRIDDLLQSTNELLERFKTPTVAEYEQPTRKMWFIEVLVPTGFKWKNTIYNNYWGMPLFNITVNDPITTVVRHGHPVGEHCYANYYCHVWEYRPTGKEHPSFLKLFRKKWEYELAS